MLESTFLSIIIFRVELVDSSSDVLPDFTTRQTEPALIDWKLFCRSRNVAEHGKVLTCTAFLKQNSTCDVPFIIIYEDTVNHCFSLDIVSVESLFSFTAHGLA